jgi:predicted PurR-regulated permease PerM
MEKPPSTITLLGLGFKLVFQDILYSILLLICSFFSIILILLTYIIPQFIYNSNNINNILIIKENANLLKENSENTSENWSNLRTTVQEKIESGVEEVNIEVYSLIESVVNDSSNRLDIISTIILSELKLMFFIK